MIKENLKTVFDIFPRLLERESQLAATLSGGEQQMLAVGRAYMTGRKMMLLDEPSMGLAPLMMLSMFDALKEINQAGTTILLVEQNAPPGLEVCPARLCDRERKDCAGGRIQVSAGKSGSQESLPGGMRLN